MRPAVREPASATRLPRGPYGERRDAPERTELGERIRRARRDRGLTQAQLAELAGVSRTMIPQLERDVVPSPDLAVRLAEALDVDAVEFFDLRPCPCEDECDVLTVRGCYANGHHVRTPEGRAFMGAIARAFFATPEGQAHVERLVESTGDPERNARVAAGNREWWASAIDEERRARLEGMRSVDHAGALKVYLSLNDLWAREQVAELLGVDRVTVGYYEREGMLDVAEVFAGGVHHVKLYRPADAKLLARELLRANRKQMRDPDRVKDWALARGASLERANELKCRRQLANARIARLRAGTSSAAERHARWNELWQQLQEQHRDEQPRRLLGDVALLDWQQHPEDWPRDRYPAARHEPSDFADGYVRENARDRVAKALQRLRTNS